MEKLFRIQIVKFFKQALGALHGFEYRSINADAVVEYPQRPIVILANSQRGTEYFFVVTPFGSSPGKVLVELGWKPESNTVYPAVNVDRILDLRKLGTAEFDWLRESFSTRLAPLCNRGASEMVWDMFSPEIWNEAIESFKEYSRRMAFRSSDEALRVFSSKGFNEQYAASQVEMVCSDILGCMKEFGVPFLNHAAACRGTELSVGL